MPEDMIGFDWCCHQLIKSFNEEDKSLRQLPMVAKLLDDNKTEKIICTVLKLHRPYSSSINLSNVQGGGNSLGSNPKGQYLDLEKEEVNFCVVFT